MAGKGQQMLLTFCDTEPDERTNTAISPVLENSTLVPHEPKAPAEPAVLSVSELAERIRDAIDTPLLTNICVQGE
ncbi:MAG TPA: hypothetical protein O0X44_03640, partial [Methanocorpusculum sp.]|nr:hypothetical protein [Methanocorpusculum sp.]